MESKIFVLAGPSGSGESTITKALINKYSNLRRLVTATTRQPRNEEKDGIDYYFLTKERFKEEIANGNIEEYTYIENRDTYYGSWIPQLEKNFKDGFVVVANLDAVGLRYFREKYNAVGIFIKPDSIDNLEKRIKGRDLEITDEELAKRIENAKKELEEEERLYDYSIVNMQGKLNEAVAEVESVLVKEKYNLIPKE